MTALELAELVLRLVQLAGVLAIPFGLYLLVSTSPDHDERSEQ